jgi:hypothetical protein
VSCWGGYDADGFEVPIQLEDSSGIITDAQAIAVGFDWADPELKEFFFVLRAGGALWMTQRQASQGTAFKALQRAVNEDTQAPIGGVDQMSANDHLVLVAGGKLQMSDHLSTGMHLQDVTTPANLLTATAAYGADCLRVNGGVSCQGSISAGQVGNGLAQAVPVPTRVATDVAQMWKGPRCTTLLGKDHRFSAFGACPVYGNGSDDFSKPQVVAKIPADATLVRSGQAAQADSADEDQRAYVIEPGKAMFTELTTAHPPAAGTLSASNATDVIVGTYWTLIQRSDKSADLVAVADQAETHGLFQDIASVLANKSKKTLHGDGVAMAPWAHHACTWTSTSLSCWGLNEDGQVMPGNPTPADVPTPYEIPLPNVTKVVVAAAQTCALADGQVHCWGNNEQYQLGQTPMADTIGGALIQLDTGKVTDLVAGPDYFCAYLDAETPLQCWGLNGYGALGNGTLSDPATPTPVLGPVGEVKELAAGWGSICARMCDDSVWCWGNSPYGEVGNGATYTESTWSTVRTAP